MQELEATQLCVMTEQGRSAGRRLKTATGCGARSNGRTTPCLLDDHS